MTNLLAKLRPFLPWLALVAALVVGGFVLAGYLNRQRTRVAAAERRAEAAELRAQGLQVAHDATQKELDAVREASAVLAAELDRIKHASPGAEVVATATGSSGWIPLWPPAPTNSAPDSPPAPVVNAPASPGATPTQPARRCMVFEGEMLEVRVAGAALETRGGNAVVTGTAAVWLQPVGGLAPAQLFEVPLSLDVKMKAPPSPPGWGAGAIALAGRWGWAVGPAVSAPPLRVLGLDVTATGGVGVGPNGEWAGALLGLVRW